MRQPTTCTRRPSCLSCAAQRGPVDTPTESPCIRKREVSLPPASCRCLLLLHCIAFMTTCWGSKETILCGHFGTLYERLIHAHGLVEDVLSHLTTRSAMTKSHGRILARPWPGRRAVVCVGPCRRASCQSAHAVESGSLLGCVALFRAVERKKQFLPARRDPPRGETIAGISWSGSLLGWDFRGQRVMVAMLLSMRLPICPCVRYRRVSGIGVRAIGSPCL